MNVGRTTEEEMKNGDDKERVDDEMAPSCTEKKRPNIVDNVMAII